MAGGPVQQPYAGVDFISQSRIYEFGYRSDGGAYWKKSVGGLNIFISTFCVHYTIINFYLLL
jgi:hypothetical protein